MLIEPIGMSRGVKRFTDLRAWQACDVFKKAIYRLCELPVIAKDFERKRQIEESSGARGTPIPEQRTANPEQETPNPEERTANRT